MVDEKIEPALTAEEWIDSEWRTTPYEVNSSISVDPSVHLLVFRHDRETRAIPFATPREFAAIIALANHALPDGHPLKITRQDAADMQEIAKHGDWFGVSDVARVAAKLAALLPPDDAAR